MICLLAGNFDEALTWASGQNLDRSEWFFPKDLDDIKNHTSFHVLVIGTAGQNVTPFYFERVYSIAKERGRIGR